jgi:MFS family permease
VFHVSTGNHTQGPAGQGKYAWYKELNRYHWFVVIVASVGWMFDTMDQQLFNLARKPAITELLGGNAPNAVVDEMAGYATSIFMIGWALGGVLFGVLGDRIGRVKTMTLTILTYSIFTGIVIFSVAFGTFRYTASSADSASADSSRSASRWLRGGSPASPALRSRAGAGDLRVRQHAGRPHRHPPRPVGAIRRD